MTDRELLEQIAQKVTNMERELNLTKAQQLEQGEILQALRHAQESQTAQIDQISCTVARIEGWQRETDKAIERIEGWQRETDKAIERMAGDISFLVRKAVEHDDDIRELRRAK